MAQRHCLLTFLYYSIYDAERSGLAVRLLTSLPIYLYYRIFIMIESLVTSIALTLIVTSGLRNRPSIPHPTHSYYTICNIALPVVIIVLLSMIIPTLSYSSFLTGIPFHEFNIISYTPYALVSHYHIFSHYFHSLFFYHTPTFSPLRSFVSQEKETIYIHLKTHQKEHDFKR